MFPFQASHNSPRASDDLMGLEDAFKRLTLQVSPPRENALPKFLSHANHNTFTPSSGCAPVKILGHQAVHNVSLLPNNDDKDEKIMRPNIADQCQVQSILAEHPRPSPKTINEALKDVIMPKTCTLPSSSPPVFCAPLRQIVFQANQPSMWPSQTGDLMKDAVPRKFRGKSRKFAAMRKRSSDLTKDAATPWTFNAKPRKLAAIHKKFMFRVDHNVPSSSSKCDSTSIFTSHFIFRRSSETAATLNKDVTPATTDSVLPSLFGSIESPATHIPEYEWRKIPTTRLSSSRLTSKMLLFQANHRSDVPCLTSAMSECIVVDRVCPLLALPLELRNMVYHYLWDDKEEGSYGKSRSLHDNSYLPSLALAFPEIRLESSVVFFQQWEVSICVDVGMPFTGEYKTRHFITLSHDAKSTCVLRPETQHLLGKALANVTNVKFVLIRLVEHEKFLRSRVCCIKIDLPKAHSLQEDSVVVEMANNLERSSDGTITRRMAFPEGTPEYELSKAAKTNSKPRSLKKSVLNGTEGNLCATPGSCSRSYWVH